MWVTRAVAIIGVLSTSGYSLVQCTQSLRLDIVNHSNSDPCNGGNVGLTDTSIQVQYRIIRTKVSEWKTLDEIDPIIGFNGTLDLPSNESSVESVQFRLLQLEHGGGSCNCWRVEEAVVMRNGSNTDISTDRCFETSTDRNFCDGIASRARGFISRLYGIDEANTGKRMCPNGSDVALIANKGLSLPPNCPIGSLAM